MKKKFTITLKCFLVSRKSISKTLYRFVVLFMCVAFKYGQFISRVAGNLVRKRGHPIGGSNPRTPESKPVMYSDDVKIS